VLVGWLGHYMEWYAVVPAIVLFVGLMFGALADVNEMEENLKILAAALIFGLILSWIIGADGSVKVNDYYSFYSTLLLFLFPVIGYTMIQWIRDAGHRDPFES
jgi:hypothetical protein